jgi:hypothetical protein
VTAERIVLSLESTTVRSGVGEAEHAAESGVEVVWDWVGVVALGVCVGDEYGRLGSGEQGRLAEEDCQLHYG